MKTDNEGMERGDEGPRIKRETETDRDTERDRDRDRETIGKNTGGSPFPQRTNQWSSVNGGWPVVV